MEPVTGETLKRAYRATSGLYIHGLDTDDLAQIAALGALRARVDYRPELGPFGPFEWLCMRRAVMEAVRAARWPKRGGGVRDAPLPAEHPAPGDLADLVAARLELRRLLDRLPELSELERRSVVGFAVGATYAELGATKPVDNAYRRGRAKLAA